MQSLRFRVCSLPDSRCLCFGVEIAGKEEVGVFSGEEKVCVEILLVFSEIERMMTECKKGLRKSGGPFVLWMHRG